MNLLTQNSKIKKNKLKTFNFGIPAYKSVSGLFTCPNAKDCIKGCYARQGAYIWSNVADVFEERLKATQSEFFAVDMIEAIIMSGAEQIRIHDSGDFYDASYLCKWFTVMKALPYVKFYAYTKQTSLFKMYDGLNAIPDNFTYLFSFGGHQDHLINVVTDRHCKVFSSSEELERAGYINATDNDELCLTDNHRVGIVYHGFKSRKMELQ